MSGEGYCALASNHAKVSYKITAVLNHTFLISLPLLVFFYTSCCYSVMISSCNVLL